MKKTIFILTICTFMFSCFNNEIVYYMASTRLHNTSRHMNLDGYWISHHPYPDKVIMDKKKIKEFNIKILENTDLAVDDISKFPKTYETEMINKKIFRFFELLSKNKLYDKDGKVFSNNFFEKIYENLNLEQEQKKIIVKFGFTIRQTDQRVIPYSERMNDEKNDIMFDNNQMSLLDIATTVAVLHTSLDKEWLFVKGPISYGWIKSRDITICSNKQLTDYKNNKFIIITSSKAEIYTDKKLKDYYDFARMGVKLKYIKKTASNICQVKLPFKNNNNDYMEIDGYISFDDVNDGYLPYTPRTIIEQSFKLLNTPYGWGGMFGEQDCSKMICEVFSTAGIYFPRNSWYQGFLGESIGEFDDDMTITDRHKIIIENAVGGITLFQLRGHIMIYLGKIDEIPYVIHSTWGYSEKMPLQKDRVRAINKVVVSDLSLGEGSKKKSLIERIVNARIIK